MVGFQDCTGIFLPQSTGCADTFRIAEYESYKTRSQISMGFGIVLLFGTLLVPYIRSRYEIPALEEHIIAH